MIFNDDKEDYFDSSQEIEEPVKTKKPKLKPEDPDYWESDESEFEHLRPNGNWIKRGWIVAAICVVIALIVAYFYYIRPSVSEAYQYGYIDNIEKRGKIITTYEGALIPYKDIMDTTRIFKGDFIFSVKDPVLATQLLKMQAENVPARLTYRKYSSSAPWRGDSRIVVTKVDTADVTKLLPPEFAPYK